MRFFAPLMLFALLAAALPLVIHLFNRHTAERLRWGAWMFLAESMRRQRRRLKLEELVLLALRTLVLALAALAFARPFLPEMRLADGDTDKDVVIVLDASASMQLKGVDGRSAFEAARTEIVRLVERSPRGTAFGLVLGDSTPVILTPTPFSTRRELLEILDRVECRSGTMDAPRTLAAAAEVLAAGNHPVKEVVIYGDGQGHGWRAGEAEEWAGVEVLLRRFPIRPQVVWRVLAAPAQVRNAAISAAVPSRRLVGCDRPLGYEITVANSGSEAFSPGQLTLAVDGTERQRFVVGQLPVGASRTFSASLAFATTGVHEVVFALTQGDDITGDSIVTNRVDVLGSLDVLLVNGRPAATGFDSPTAFVAAALRPERRGAERRFLVRPRVVRAAELEQPETFEGVAATVLCDVAELSPVALRQLTEYVGRGGGLLAVAGEKSVTPLYTNSVFAAAWTNFAATAPGVEFAHAPLAARALFAEVVPTGGVEIAALASDGESALVIAPRGRGRSAMLAVPLEMSASALPARPEFVPFVHELVYALAGTNSVTGAGDLGDRSREGDLAALTAAELDAVSVTTPIAFARSEDDALAAVMGRSFGVEIYLPLAVLAFLCLLTETVLSLMIDRRRGGSRSAAALWALRALAALVFVWIFIHLVWVHDRTRTIHRRVAVLTDRSNSMTVTDPGPDGAELPPRCVRATNIAERLSARLAKRYDLEEMVFGGEETSLAAALERVVERIPADELAGAVFVTDGRDNSELDVEAVARRFARAGARIATVTLGAVTGRADVAIAALKSPPIVYLGDKVRVVATLRARELAGERILVRLWDAERLAEEREYRIEGADWECEAYFQDDPPGRGIRRYRLEIVSPAGDKEPRNDSWEFEVAMSDDRTNVLVLDRRPRWEFRYLRNLFHARDKSVHLQYCLTEPDRLSGTLPAAKTAADARRPFGEAEASAFPVDRDSWRRFDVIIIGDLGPDDFEPEALSDIRYCVEERGAMLVFIAGAAAMPAAWARTPLAELMPVALTNAEGQTTARWIAAAARPTIPPAYARHPILTLSDAPSESDRAWAEMGPWSHRVEGVVAKPGTETLAFFEGETALSAPLMVAGEFGRGRTLMLTADESWRLRYRQGDLLHHRLWSNILAWGTGEKLRDGVEHARLGTDRLRYPPRSAVKVLMRLEDRESLPLVEAAFEAQIRRPDGRQEALAFVKRPGLNGYYEATVDDTAVTGTYSVVVTSATMAEKLGSRWPGEIRSCFTVGESLSSAEWADLTADRRLPQQLAQLTGAAVLAEDAADDFDPEMFGAGRGEVTEHVESHLWDHPLAFIVLVLALGALWLIRKRRGMA